MVWKIFVREVCFSVLDQYDGDSRCGVKGVLSRYTSQISGGENTTQGRGQRECGYLDKMKETYRGAFRDSSWKIGKETCS